MLDAAAGQHPQTHRTRREVPLIVQLLGTCLFGAFAIVSVIFAFKAWWPAGLILALVLGWRGNFTSSTPPQMSAEEIVAQVRTLVPEQAEKTSGNANFDAYRSDMLQRLEQEQNLFDGFLNRLRDAKDKTEFDQFMDERAHRAKGVSDAG